MIKKSIFFSGAFFFLLCVSTNAQIKTQQTVDSLIAICLKNRRNIAAFKKNATALLSLSKKTNNTKGLLSANQFLSRIELGAQHYQEAYQYCHSALEAAKKEHNTNAYHAISATLAMVHFQTKYYDSAMYYYRGNLAFFKNKSIQKFQYYQTQRDIGNVFTRLKKLDSAQYYLKNALTGFKSIHNDLFVAQTYNMLAEIDFLNKDYNKALDFANQSLAISKAIHFRPNLATTYNLLGRIYDEIGNTAQADKYFDLANKTSTRPPKGSAYDASWAAREKSIKRHKDERINTLKNQQVFYRYDLFIALLTLIVLIVVVKILYNRNTIKKQEIVQLQQKLNSFNRAYKALKKEQSTSAKTKTKTKTQRIEVPSGKLLKLEDIVYLKSDAHYIEIYLENEKTPLLERISLTKLLQLLPKDGFIQTQKSYAVNIHKIKIINTTQIMMISGIWVKLSPKYKAELKARLNTK